MFELLYGDGATTNGGWANCHKENTNTLTRRAHYLLNNDLKEGKI